MKSEIIITADGSHTIYIPELNECYHSKNGALTESMHIFIEAGCRFAAKDKTSLNILEVGFGTGLNALLTLFETMDDSLKVFYQGVEPYRVDKKMLDILNYSELTGVSNAKLFFEDIHKTKTEIPKKITDSFSLLICENKIEYIILKKSFFDLVYFDAFAPDINPEIWEQQVFEKISTSMKTGGVLVTYSCKGDVKRALKASGFGIEKLPGPPGKREFLRAIKL